jgi:hypothetical protein
MRRWAKRAAVSAALIAALGCPGRQTTAPAPSAEPELRVGLAVGAALASIGGAEGGELFVTEAASGTAVGSIPAGVRWVVVPDSADSSRLRLIRPSPDSGRSGALRGIAVVNVTENRFVIANGRRYRGGLAVTSGRGGLTVVNRLGLGEHVANLARNPSAGPMEAAVLAQAVVSRSFLLGIRAAGNRWDLTRFADTGTRCTSASPES